MGKFFIFNTGCIRRGLDSIRLYNYLTANGWVFTRRVGQADLILVSTCGAVEEKEVGSLNAIQKVVKRKSDSARVIVSGYLPKINPERIHDLGEFEFVPTGNLDKLDEDAIDGFARFGEEHRELSRQCHRCAMCRWHPRGHVSPSTQIPAAACGPS